MPRLIGPLRPGFSPYRSPALGALGTETVAAQAGTAVAAKGAAAGAASIATYAGAGAAAGPIGLVVGAVVGIVMTKLLTKNYLNVAQMNAAEQNELAAFNQYKSVQGRAPGRQYGLAVMQSVWNGALHAGYFPLNQRKLCFHEGCSQYPGDGSWIQGAIHGGSGTGNFSFPAAWSAFQSATAPVKATVAAVVSSPQVIRTTVTARGTSLQGLGRLPPVHPAFAARRRILANARAARVGLRPARGLGDLGAFGSAAVAGVPWAVTLVDQFFIPFNSKDSPPWAVPQNTIEHLLLYDVADAYLATVAPSSTPFVAANFSATASGAAIVPAASTAPAVPTAVNAGQVAPSIAATGSAGPQPSILPTAPTPAPTSVPLTTQQAQGIQVGLVFLGPITLPSGGGTVNVWADNAQPNANLYAYDPTQTSAPANFRKVGTMPNPNAQPQLAPTATPQLPSTPPAIAQGAGVVTTTGAATAANLDASLAAQGFARFGTTSDGFPLYSQAGNVFVYQNGNLFPYSSVAQAATTGGAGTGISAPVTGLDPNTLAMINNAIAQGLSAQQASAAGASYLQANGVPVTPTVQAQLDDAAQNPVIAPTGVSPVVLIGGGLLLVLLLGRKKSA